jgi:ABC-2 type transport system permease protein
MHRVWAIIERDLRRFRRSFALIMISMVMPLVQLVVLGYASALWTRTIRFRR